MIRDNECLSNLEGLLIKCCVVRRVDTTQQSGILQGAFESVSVVLNIDWTTKHRI